MKHQCDPTFLLGTPARRPLSWGHPQVSSLAHACPPTAPRQGRVLAGGHPSKGPICLGPRRKEVSTEVL